MCSVVGWCGRCYANVRGRENYRGHRGYRSSPASYPKETKAVDKPKGKVAAKPLPEGMGGWLREDCPLLWAHIADTTWSDGTRRTTSTFLFTVEAGKLKGCLNDREGRCSLWRAGDTPQDVAKSLEEALEGGSGDWKPWR